MRNISALKLSACAVFFLIMLLPLSVYAAGAHESLTCTGCHSIHTAEGDIIFAVAPNKKDINSSTGAAFEGTVPLCTACHQVSDNGGMEIAPIDSHISHPYGLKSVNSKVARVPDGLLRDGKFECVSCHDPHPSNPNYKYLRADTENGAQMQKFCAVCHPMKVDPKVNSSRILLFNSMDEKLAGFKSATE